MHISPEVAFCVRAHMRIEVNCMHIHGQVWTGRNAENAVTMTFADFGGKMNKYQNFYHSKPLERKSLVAIIKQLSMVG